jgi:hypothetical protein
MLIADLDRGSVWFSLSLANKIFLLYFCGVAVYTLGLCLYVFVYLHSLTKQRTNDDSNCAETSLDRLNRRLANLRQLHLCTLYLFGFCIAISIPSVFVTIENSKGWPIGRFIGTLIFLFYFYAAIFVGFLLLHSLQWVASVRVDSFVRQRS